MVQAAVGHEKAVAPGDLSVDDATDVDARLADNEPAELEDDLRPGQARVEAVQDGREVACDERDVEALVAGKIRNAQAAADVEDPYRARRVLREPQRELDALFLRLGNRVGAKVLRAAEDVEALEVERKLADSVQHGRDALGVDAERLGPAAHLHPGALELEVRVDA